jgi:hypothetical protein
MEYIILLVDRPKEALRLNAKLQYVTTPDFKMEAFSRGQALVGLRYKHSRPTRIIDYIEDREGERFERWFNGCVRPMLARGEYVRARYDQRPQQ